MAHRRLLLLFLGINACVGLMYGMLHQAGVSPTPAALISHDFASRWTKRQNDVCEDSKDLASAEHTAVPTLCVAYVHTYMPPRVRAKKSTILDVRHPHLCATL